MNSPLLAVLLLLAAAPLRADWLLETERAARAAGIPGEIPPEKRPTEWQPFESPSRLFRMELPPEGWRPFEEEDALGTVLRALGPDSPSGTLRATLSIRLIDRETPNFQPIKKAVDSMRQDAPGRGATPVRTLRVPAGLARTFEITQTRRPPDQDGPGFPEEIHQYVAVIPRGREDYFLVRLVSSRDHYLELRDDFVRMLRSIKPIGAR